MIDMPYSDNRLHPTQKPIASLKPLIEAFTQKQELVFDPFCLGAFRAVETSLSL